MTTTIAVYRVKPFSLVRRRYPQGEELPCAICGKPVKAPWKHIGVLIQGGSAWADEADLTVENPYDLPGYMGEFPIGNDCHKNHLDRVIGVCD